MGLGKELDSIRNLLLLRGKKQTQFNMQQSTFNALKAQQIQTEPPALSSPISLISNSFTVRYLKHAFHQAQAEARRGFRYGQ